MEVVSRAEVPGGEVGIGQQASEDVAVCVAVAVGVSTVGTMNVVAVGRGVLLSCAV